MTARMSLTTLPSRPTNRLTTFHVRAECIADQQRRQCLQLRLDGCSNREIARQMNLGQTTVNGYLKQAMARTRGDIAALAVQIRRDERTRLEAILAKWQPVATGSPSVRKAQRAASIVLMAHTALRALHGLSAPSSADSGAAQPPIPPAPPAPPPPAPEPEPEPEPDDDPAKTAFIERLGADLVYQGAYHGLLPTAVGYDVAWDKLEDWQPGKYKPENDVETYLRANWKILMAGR